MEELQTTLAELEERLSGLDLLQENDNIAPAATPQSAQRWSVPETPRFDVAMEEPTQPPFSSSQTASVLENASLRQIDSRLDEISRALVAATRHNGQQDAERLDRIEQRLQALTGQLDQSLAEQNSGILLRRLGEIAQRVDVLNQSSKLPQDAFEPLAKQINLLANHLGRLIDNPRHSDFSAVERRVDFISEKLVAMERTTAANRSAVIAQMDARFAELADRLDARSDYHLDRNTIQNLERQLATIAQHLAQPSPEFIELKPRIETIERRIENSRETVLEAAREATENAIERLLEHEKLNDSAIAQQFSADLKSLEALARSAEERNDKSFQAVHEILVKIVDRLADLEQYINSKSQTAPKAGLKAGPAARNASQSSKNFSLNSLSIAPARTVSHDNLADRRHDGPALGEKLGVLKAKSVVLPQEEAPIAPEHADTETALDLNAIMRRVREERKEKHAAGDNAVKADFISAARRAAQEAANETKQLEQELEIELESQSGPIESFLNRRRKPILMGIGAIMLAVTGMQFAPDILKSYAVDETTSQHAQVPEIDPSITGSVAPQTEANLPAQASIEAQDLPQEPAQTIEEVIAVTPEATPTDAINTAQPNIEQPDIEQSVVERPVELEEIPQDIGPQALRDAAAKGDVNAFFEIGNRYMEGHGTAVDFAKAAHWFQKAAEQNFAPAQYRLGSFNEKGLGMPRDLNKAMHLYELAAKQGNASAMHNLAVLYASGANGTPDNAAAVEWFLEAAELDVRDSQYNLGILAAQGLGMPADLEESYKWFSLAANSGDKDSADKRDQIAAVLTPAQLAKAKGAVELWKAKPLNEAANIPNIPESWLEQSPVTTAAVDTKKAVRNIQLILQKNGYDVGTADGLMGTRTRNAIMDVQKAHGLEPTGEIDRKLADLLLSMNS